MQITKTIPQEDVVFNVRLITLNPSSRIAMVRIDSTEGRQNVEVDLTEILSKATSTQLNIIKGFIKAIGAAALKVAVSELADDLFPETPVEEIP